MGRKEVVEYIDEQGKSPLGEVLVILLNGGTKKRQSADIKQAQLLWAEYKRRKKVK